jgi:serine protease inhibitor
LRDFSKLCNDLAFTFWKSITADGISQSRSVVISPFALTSTLAMIFLGARGQTSGEMNDLLKLDDTISFNPHVVFRNISESVEQSRNSGIAAAAFARELYSDRSKGKLLPYFKEKAQQFYGAHVEEVNFNVINDILRRRTNLLVKRHTYNKIKEYLKTNNIWVNEPLAAVSANVFMVSACLLFEFLFFLFVINI